MIVKRGLTVTVMLKNSYILQLQHYHHNLRNVRHGHFISMATVDAGLLECPKGVFVLRARNASTLAERRSTFPLQIQDGNVLSKEKG